MVESYQWGGWVGLLGGWVGGWWVWWVGWLAPNIFVSPPAILKMVHQIK